MSLLHVLSMILFFMLTDKNRPLTCIFFDSSRVILLVFIRNRLFTFWSIL